MDENIFDDADIRANTLKLLAEEGSVDVVSQELASRMGENYFELRTMAAVKFKNLVDKKNCLIPFALPFLDKGCNQSMTQDGMSQLKSDYEDLVDWLVTMYLLRGMEIRGKVDNPFTLEIGENPNE